MLPETMELQAPQKKEWPLIPAEVYQTEITDIEFKTEPNRYKERETDPAKKAQMPDEKQVMKFEFTIIEDGPHYGRKVWQRMTPMKPYPPQANGKSTWVYRLATAIEGHPITREEADQFGAKNINDYLHRQVKVYVIHSAPDKNGKIWNNVESLITAKEQLPPFDEKKVPTDNLPEKPTDTSSNPPVLEANPTPGFDKFKAASLGAKNKPATDISVEDIPF